VIEWETALREGGALEAATEARDEGLVRFIGITGHGLTVARMHARSLERFPFDSVLVPYSYVQMRDERYAADFEALAALCNRRGVALQTIKSIGLAPWNGREQTAATWYEPLRDQADIDLAVHWVLQQPVEGLWKTSGLAACAPAGEAQPIGQRAMEIRLEAFVPVRGRLETRLLRVPQVDVERLDLFDQEEDRLAGCPQLVTVRAGEPRPPTPELIDLVFVEAFAHVAPDDHRFPTVCPSSR
jgi:hypothetical protein